MITKITLGIRDFNRFIPQEDVENMAVLGDKDAIAALSRGEKMIFQPRRSQAYVELDIQDGFDHRSEKYTGTVETMPKRDDFESEDLFIAALEKWH